MSSVYVEPGQRQWLTHWLIPVGMMILFLLYQSWPIFTEPQFYSDDQRSNWMLAIRQHEPTFLSHDQVFGDPLFQGHYIPVYLSILYTLIQVFDGIDGAMIFLHTLMLAGYLLSMFLLLRFITGNNLIAAFIAIASALSRGSIAQEIWAATDMRAVMPRTAFLVTVPVLCLLLYKWLPAKTWWRIPLLGGLIGLATNFHPPSGLFLLQITLTLVLIFSSSTLPVTLGKMVLAGVGFALGGLPTVWAVVRGVIQSRDLPPAGSFQEFAEVLHWRMRTEFPFPPEQVNFVGTVLTASVQQTLVLIYLLGMGLWLGIAIWFYHQGIMKIQDRRPILTWMLAWLLLLNLPLAYLVTTFLALDLMLVTIAYWITRLARQRYDAPDIWSLTILTCAGAYSFVLSAVLGWVWETFELWSLTSFFGEQARMSRLIYLPLFIFLARWFYELLFQSQDKSVGRTIVLGLIAGLAVRHWHFLDAWGSAEWGMGLSLMLLALVGTWVCLAPTPSKIALALALALSLSATTYLWLYIVGVNLPWLWLLAGLGGILGGLTKETWHTPPLRWGAAIGTVSVLIFGIFFGPTLSQVDDPGFKAPLRTQAMKALGLYEYGIPSDYSASTAFYQWAKQDTDEKALFYFNDREYEFRAFATRAVTHSWKDVGGGYYTPPLAIEYFRRYQKLEEAYQDSARLLACAEAYGVDYIVAKEGQPSLALPVAFANELYLVYATDDSLKGDPALCQ